MKWLLISNHSHTNPGDVWVRLGIEKLIEIIDPENTRFILQRDYNDELTEPQAFDRSVICGMPLVWSNYIPTSGCSTELSSCLTHGSWGPLTGWLSEHHKMIIAGFGLSLQPGDPWRMENQAETVERVKTELFKRARMVYCRQAWGARMFNVPAHYCPSVFAGMHLQSNLKTLKLFNAMIGGSHFPWFSRMQYGCWQDNLQALANMARESGFQFIAHNQLETQLGLHLGWKDEEIHALHNEPERMLETYSRCSQYLGNRIHGAIVARSFNAAVRCIGYDSRLEAVRLVGGEAMLPEEMLRFSQDEWRYWMTQAPTPKALDLDTAWKHQLELFSR